MALRNCTASSGRPPWPSASAARSRTGDKAGSPRLTGQRRRARERAADARLELLQARRVIAEQTHGAVPHDLEREREASAARAAENLRERQAERMIRRERGFGREL